MCGVNDEVNEHLRRPTMRLQRRQPALLGTVGGGKIEVEAHEVASSSAGAGEGEHRQRVHHRHRHVHRTKARQQVHDDAEPERVELSHRVRVVLELPTQKMQQLFQHLALALRRTIQLYNTSHELRLGVDNQRGLGDGLQRRC